SCRRVVLLACTGVTRHPHAFPTRRSSDLSASVDLWLRDAAPSSALRRWFGNDPERWAEFQERYRAELERRPEILRLLADLRRRLDRKSTRLNSSHVKISYAVFCSKKKKNN